MATLKAGHTIKGRYRIDEFLGSGGMAEVYKVFDKVRRMDLAMKVLKQDLAEDREFLRRFQREAKRYAKLQHKNIVRFYGLEQEGRLAFMLLDYIDGRTLKTEIFNEGAPLSPCKISLIMQDVCNALNFAHKSGYVHCDVKPANIMINRQGTVYLTDFGIAREVDATTATMVGYGAPAYMAPEQVKGLDPKPTTDIDSLGVTLYEMVTGGRRPFTGQLAKTTGTASNKVRWEQLKLKPPSPRVYNANISPELESVIMRCLEKDSRKRYRSTMTLLKALQKALPKPNPALLENRHCLRKAAPKGVSVLLKKFMGWLGGLAEKIPVPFIQQNPMVLLAAFLVILTSFIALIWPDNPDPIPDMHGKGNGVEQANADGSQPNPNTGSEQPTVKPRPTNTPMPEFPPACSQVGQEWVDPTDGMWLSCVPAGDFIMGSTDYNLFAKTRRGELLYEKIYLDPYWVDQTEVTHSNFKQFVNETGYKTDAEKGNEAYTMIISTNKWSTNSSATWQHPRGTGETPPDDHPVSQVSWNDAMAYCEWAGRDLPSEAQWEKAARGTDGYYFPFETSDDYALCVNANYNDNTLSAKFHKDCDDGYKFTAPVTEDFYCDSYLGDCASVLLSDYKVFNMLGNVSEWVLDDWNEKFYRTMSSSNPVYISDSPRKSLRGGSWGGVTDRVRPTHRDYDLANRSFDTMGFRCVYNP
jgi:serine/threonine-protein kinase